MIGSERHHSGTQWETWTNLRRHAKKGRASTHPPCGHLSLAVASQVMVVNADVALRSGGEVRLRAVGAHSADDPQVHAHQLAVDSGHAVLDGWIVRFSCLLPGGTRPERCPGSRASSAAWPPPTGSSCSTGDTQATESRYGIPYRTWASPRPRRSQPHRRPATRPGGTGQYLVQDPARPAQLRGRPGVPDSWPKASATCKSAKLKDEARSMTCAGYGRAADLPLSELHTAFTRSAAGLHIPSLSCLYREPRVAPRTTDSRSA
jgi:hypothetical protein